MLRRAIKYAINSAGFEIYRSPIPGRPARPINPQFDRIHYACGRNILPGWLNVDISPTGPENYKYVDLTSGHPFPSNSFSFALCEDFIEHITQADSLMFLLEVHRTLKSGGVLRLTCPGLEGVLTHHFGARDFSGFLRGRLEAYTQHVHVHFYSRESLALVANHIGFDIRFVMPNESSHPELQGIDTRLELVHLHAELTKRHPP